MKNMPVTLLIILAILSLFIGFVYYSTNKSSSNANEKLSSREIAQLCLPNEGTAEHIHQHLVIEINKQQILAPAETGIDPQKNCIKSLHVHDSTGVIHVESPVKKDFRLSDFFAVWGQSFTRNEILNSQTDSGHGLKIYVNGRESQDFENLVLEDHQEIFIDYYNLNDGPDPLPQSFDFNQV